MAAPAQLRSNLQVPFPATVIGGAPVTIGKQNGVWTVQITAASVGQLVTLPAGSLFLGYNPNPPTPGWFSFSISSLVASSVSSQRSVTSTPITVSGNDAIININVNTGAQTINLPAASSRNGAPLTFHDAGGNFPTSPITLAAAGGDTINGQATIVLRSQFQSVTIQPYTDGVNVGWFII